MPGRSTEGSGALIMPVLDWKFALALAWIRVIVYQIRDTRMLSFPFLKIAHAASSSCSAAVARLQCGA